MKTRYMLDTNICIYLVKQKPIEIMRRFEQLEVGELTMSTITYGELWYDAVKSQYSKKTVSILEELISLISPLPPPLEKSKHYGKIRHELEKLAS